MESNLEHYGSTVIPIAKRFCSLARIGTINCAEPKSRRAGKQPGAKLAASVRNRCMEPGSEQFQLIFEQSNTFEDVGQVGLAVRVQRRCFLVLPRELRALIRILRKKCRVLRSDQLTPITETLSLAYFIGWGANI